MSGIMGSILQNNVCDFMTSLGGVGGGGGDLILSDDRLFVIVSTTKIL